MATYTENYEMKLPEREDSFNILSYNENFETIDAKLAENESAMEVVNAKIGNADDTNNTTVFGKLNNNNGSIIKSIQHVTSTYPMDSITIEAVDVSKCIVLFERLGDTTGHAAAPLTYTLYDTYIKVTSLSDKSLTVGFWIIEFN